jgi:hypothetical protein
MRIGAGLVWFEFRITLKKKTACSSSLPFAHATLAYFSWKQSHLNNFSMIK